MFSQTTFKRVFCALCVLVQSFSPLSMLEITACQGLRMNLAEVPVPLAPSSANTNSHQSKLLLPSSVQANSFLQKNLRSGIQCEDWELHLAFNKFEHLLHDKVEGQFGDLGSFEKYVHESIAGDQELATEYVLSMFDLGLQVARLHALSPLKTNMARLKKKIEDIRKNGMTMSVSTKRILPFDDIRDEASHNAPTSTSTSNTGDSTHSVDSSVTPQVDISPDGRVKVPERELQQAQFHCENQFLTLFTMQCSLLEDVFVHRMDILYQEIIIKSV